VSKTLKIGVAVAAAAVASLATLGLTGVASSASLNYVALGDSYASGYGAGGTELNSTCKTNTNAYPELYAKATGATLDFQACSGAKIETVLDDQLETLSASTNLVSVTVGGNDTGFADVMDTCVRKSEAECRKKVTEGEDIARNTLPGALDNLYSTIKSKAPKARVVALGYPHIYKLGGSCLFAPSDTSRGYVNEGADVLAGVIKDAAARAGFTYVDVRDSFAGHEVCSGNDWIHGVELGDINMSFHPNQAGQQAYLSKLQANAKVFYKSVRPQHS
jgi:lysophospholipase L1-like esterase